MARYACWNKCNQHNVVPTWLFGVVSPFLQRYQRLGLYYCRWLQYETCIAFNLAVLMCPEQSIEGITYPATPAGGNTTQTCPTGSTGTKTRVCSITGSWEEPTGECGNVLHAATEL